MKNVTKIILMVIISSIGMVGCSSSNPIDKLTKYEQVPMLTEEDATPVIPEGYKIFTDISNKLGELTVKDAKQIISNAEGDNNIDFEELDASFGQKAIRGTGGNTYEVLLVHDLFGDDSDSSKLDAVAILSRGWNLGYAYLNDGKLTYGIYDKDKEMTGFYVGDDVNSLEEMEQFVFIDSYYRYNPEAPQIDGRLEVSSIESDGNIKIYASTNLPDGALLRATVDGNGLTIDGGVEEVKNGIVEFDSIDNKGIKLLDGEYTIKVMLEYWQNQPKSIIWTLGAKNSNLVGEQIAESVDGTINHLINETILTIN